MSESPRVDLRASNNVLHVRTCSDSARLLAQLIVYLASYGDLGDLSASEPPPSNTPTTTATTTAATSTATAAVDLLSESTVQRVNTLMEEAMIDDVKDEKKSKGMLRV